MYKILVINPGSTSTKLAIYDKGKPPVENTIRHDIEKIRQFPNISSQLTFRKEVILEWLNNINVPVASFDAIVTRGGLVKPLVSGAYLVNEAMLADLRAAKYGEHACNLGALIAYDLAKNHSIPCYTVDPAVVDELEPVARLSGNPLFERRTTFHALNQKAVARRAARDLGKRYDECNLVVAHLGGGITVGAHHKGCVIDVNNGVEGEGAFTPERSGGLPAAQLVELCFGGKYTKPEILRMIMGGGGVSAYLGVTDMRQVEELMEQGDKRAALIFEGMGYQVAKEIGAYTAAIGEKVDAIVLTGGIAYSSKMTDLIIARVKLFAPVLVYPGEDENGALAEGAIRVLSGEEVAKVYG
ncbi:Butyrate kinase 2 [Pelotomaculum schinkii]|uniref:Probable butyrate kinase n=1 Tax=Pelotomaculum schinkii TaxID=78350 RepID=A0A4Y7R9D9_9FIRM|nr:butyrate kinase [Pelotomaculum schinkii]TEB05417.1 Butyrate kinase 2 [Pelotomaculum schinkii]